MTEYHTGPTSIPILGNLLMAMMPAGKHDPDKSPDIDPPQRIPTTSRGLHQFLWPWTHRPGMDGEHLVETYGVRVSHRIIPRNSGDSTGFSVPTHQAKWAEYLLLRAGYPLISPLFDPRHRKLLERAHEYSERSAPSRPPGGSKHIKRHGITDTFMHAIDAVLTGGKSARDRRLAIVERRPKPPAPRPQARRRSSWFTRIFGL
jgi:hypothetical protein